MFVFAKWAKVNEIQGKTIIKKREVLLRSGGRKIPKSIRIPRLLNIRECYALRFALYVGDEKRSDSISNKLILFAAW